MAAISGQIGRSPTGQEASPYLSDDLNSYAWQSYQPTPWVAGAEVKAGRYSTFRTIHGGLWAISGQESRAFFWDFYNRIHLQPSAITLGNLTSSQLRDVTVWNAYTSPKLLSSVDASGTDGITLTQPVAPPTYFAPLEERTYQLNISTNGSPVIDAAYTFVFEGEAPVLSITGRRVVIWPFIPQTRHTEVLEWKTDLLPSFNKEQRLALRAAPRQAFTFEFQLDPYQFSRAKAIATQWAHRVYGIPVWSELTRVGALAAGMTYIPVDTSYADYRDDDLVVLWESDEKFVAVETTTIAAGQINLKLPLEISFTDAYVAPVRFARTPSGMAFDRNAHDITEAKVTFTVTQNADLGAGVGYPQYRGKDVLTDLPVIVGSMTERISRAIDEFDNGSGPVGVDIRNNWVQGRKAITFDTLTRQERWAARQWLHNRRGKQVGFWLPSWTPDLVLVESSPSGSGAIVVRPIGYPLYYGAKDIMIRKTTGEDLFMRVLGGSTDVNGNEQLSLEAPLVAELLMAEVEFISFISHVRLDTDRITLTHSNAGRATINVPIMETPE